MNSYLVGGAVRDTLLGIQSTDNDWVVVGSSNQEMLANGFIAVGKHFPVYLHPTSKEEYALARRERKVGAGHQAFSFDCQPSISLEDDLLRRDITINAMARDDAGNIIDPFHGVVDLQNRVLRHVSAAFSEDPLRVFRVARFASQLCKYGFTVAPETIALMRNIVASGELATLSMERITSETERALRCAKPSMYFAILHQCGALAEIFPELASLSGVPQTRKWHPEVDCLLHTMLVIDAAAHAATNTCVRWCALLHDFGKGVTPIHILPSHQGHEHSGVPLVDAFCQRMRLDKKTHAQAIKITKLHLHYHRVFELKPASIIKLFNQLDVWRDHDLLANYLRVCEADSRGRYGFSNYPCKQTAYLEGHYQAQQQLQPRTVITPTMTPQNIKDAVYAARVAIAKRYQAEYDHTNKQ